MQYASLQVSAVLGQFLILAFVLARTDLLQQSVILKPLQTTVNAAIHPIVAIFTVNVFRCTGIRQSTVCQKRLLLMVLVRCSGCLLVVVVLFGDRKEEILLESEYSVSDKQGQFAVNLISLEVRPALIFAIVLDHLIPMP